MAEQVNLYEAKTHLSSLVDRAAAGEDIVIAKSGRPRVRLVPVERRTEPRRPGRMKDRFWFGPGWEDDVTGEFEDLSEGVSEDWSSDR